MIQNDFCWTVTQTKQEKEIKEQIKNCWPLKRVHRVKINIIILTGGQTALTKVNLSMIPIYNVNVWTEWYLCSCWTKNASTNALSLEDVQTYCTCCTSVKAQPPLSFDCSDKHRQGVNPS